MLPADASETTPSERMRREHSQEREALQSHRRAKVADLSEGDDELLGD